MKPCIDSVLAASAHNRTQLDLIIIDHESDDAETQAYLANLGEQGKARILPYKGAFNWALMNNLAVEIARGPAGRIRRGAAWGWSDQKGASGLVQRSGRPEAARSTMSRVGPPFSLTHRA